MKRKKTWSLLRRLKTRGRRHRVYSGEWKEEEEDMEFNEANESKKKKMTWSLQRRHKVFTDRPMTGSLLIGPWGEQKEDEEDMQFIGANKKKTKKTCSLLRLTKSRRGRRHVVYWGKQRAEEEEGMEFTEAIKKKRKKTCSLLRLTKIRGGKLAVY